MIFQKSQPAETGNGYLSSASTGQLRNIDALPPRTESAHSRNTRKSRQLFGYLMPWPVRGDMKKRLPTKPVWGEPPPCKVLDQLDALPGSKAFGQTASRRNISTWQ
jgi:hypothetical protein